MRTICDVCESAAAVLFCAADEAALCRPCDDKVHKCNKLASRHVRVGLADPSEVPRCDICENAPGMCKLSGYRAENHLYLPCKFFRWFSDVAFFYCEIDGSSLCLQCDMIVHVGGKRTHGRYLLLRQRVEFLTDKAGHLEPLAARETLQNGKIANGPLDANGDDHGQLNTKMIDLNTRPHQSPGQASNTQGKYSLGGGNRERDMEN